MTSLNNSFIIGQAFLSAEDKEAFSFIIRWLKDFYMAMGLSPPHSISIDRAGGLIAALNEVWPNVPYLLCL